VESHLPTKGRGTSTSSSASGGGNVLLDEAPSVATTWGAEGPSELCRCSNCRRYCDYDPWARGRFAPRKVDTRFVDA